MKHLAAGLVLLLVVGLGSFLYRNTVERPGDHEQTACTLEARVCPDGSAVGRSGPACTFAPCPLPNVEIIDAGLSFVLPAGYVADEHAYGADLSLVAAFVRAAASLNQQHTILIRSYPILAGEVGDDVILAHARFQPADVAAKSMDEFRTVSIHGRTYYTAVIERFEGTVHSVYYLSRAQDVLMFEIVEHDVSAWTDPALVVDTLPEHQAFLRMLTTVVLE